MAGGTLKAGQPRQMWRQQTDEGLRSDRQHRRRRRAGGQPQQPQEHPGHRDARGTDHPVAKARALPQSPLIFQCRRRHPTTACAAPPSSCISTSPRATMTLTVCAWRPGSTRDFCVVAVIDHRPGQGRGIQNLPPSPRYNRRPSAKGSSAMTTSPILYSPRLAVIALPMRWFTPRSTVRCEGRPADLPRVSDLLRKRVRDQNSSAWSACQLALLHKPDGK